MSDKETYTPPDKDGKCPHGVFVNSATCTKCYELKKKYDKAKDRVNKLADNLDW